MQVVQRRQILIFLTGWVAYAATYLLRKPLGVIKADLESSLTFTKLKLGWLDMALLLPYACMQIFFGSIGDKFGARLTMAVGLLISGIALITFSMWQDFYIIFLMFAISGAAQGLCWPNVCQILGSWYSEKSRNSIFGLFGTSAFAGGIAGTLLAVYLRSTYGWKQVFAFPSALVVLLGILAYLFLHTSQELNIIIPGKEDASPTINSRSISFIDLWKIPMVLEISIAMFCLKLVRYCMYMWLPLYLLQNLHYTQESAGWFSTVFEIGGVMGSAFLGIVIDRFFHGQSLVGCSMSALGSTVALFLFFWTSDFGLILNILFMGIAGTLNCGPDTLLGGSIPAEIGQAGSRNAAAAVTGLVNGFGSIGACVEGPIIGFISDQYGWNGMFYFILLLSSVGTLATYRAHVTSQRQSKVYLPLSNQM